MENLGNWISHFKLIGKEKAVFLYLVLVLVRSGFDLAVLSLVRLIILWNIYLSFFSIYKEVLNTRPLPG